MTRAYNESYLSDAKDTLSQCFDYLINDCGFEADWAATIFVSSGYAEQFERGNPAILSGMSGAELAVIGSALTNSNSVAESAEIVKPSDFYFYQNREIYETILELFNENLAIDFITVSNRLSQKDKLEAVGGVTYLRNAATNVPTTRR